MSKPRKLLQTPAALGYRMPAEWEAHEATWIAWPHNRTDWPGRFEPIPWVYAEIVRHLARVERVNILVEDEAAEAKVIPALVAVGAPAGHHVALAAENIIDFFLHLVVMGDVSAPWCEVHDEIGRASCRERG